VDGIESGAVSFRQVVKAVEIDLTGYHVLPVGGLGSRAGVTVAVFAGGVGAPGAHVSILDAAPVALALLLAGVAVLRRTGGIAEEEKTEKTGIELI